MNTFAILAFCSQLGHFSGPCEDPRPRMFTSPI